MKKLINLVLAISLFSNVALADCDWSTGITPNKDGSYTYSADCHLRVGKLVKEGEIKDQQIADLGKAIQLKDLALKASDDRVTLWMDTSGKLEDRLNRIDSLEKKNEWFYFGLGAITVIGAGFMAGKLMHP